MTGLVLVLIFAVEAAAVWLVVKTPPPSGRHFSGRQTMRRHHGHHTRRAVTS